MLEEGFSNIEISKRLNVSTKQILRIKKQLSNELRTNFTRDNLLKDKNIEFARRNIYRNIGLTLEEIGQKFGITKQAIFKQ